jgi:methylaspartate mutase sigma subunit
MSARNVSAARPHAGLGVLVTGTVSDAHTWNLIFLQHYLEEFGHSVVNLGPCVPDELLAARCRTLAPDLVVLSSVNGHGCTDGLRTVIHLRRHADLTGIPIVIGGKLGTDGRSDPSRVDSLLAAGCAAVFEDGDLAAFDEYLGTLTPKPVRVAS